MVIWKRVLVVFSREDSMQQLELSRPIRVISVESDHICTSRIYFDNAGDNVALTLYDVTLTLYNVKVIITETMLTQ